MEWIIVIIVVVLLLFGAKKIPELARGLGKARAEFTRGQVMVEKEIREAERLDREEEAQRSHEEAKPKPPVAEGNDTEIQKAAVAMGIDPEGKTDEELRILIKYKMEQG
jgi:sec-independent protein translocase protein TatA